ncbi:Acyl-CoA-binding protein [Capsicum annuum]|nr:Acyl-CoA-binding protein [Capsicum annuum]
MEMLGDKIYKDLLWYNMKKWSKVAAAAAATGTTSRERGSATATAATTATDTTSRWRGSAAATATIVSTGTTSRGRGSAAATTTTTVISTTGRRRGSPAATVATTGVDGASKGRRINAAVIGEASIRVNVAVFGGADRGSEVNVAAISCAGTTRGDCEGKKVNVIVVGCVGTEEELVVLLLLVIVSPMLAKVEENLIKDLGWLEWGCFKQRVVLESSIQGKVILPFLMYNVTNLKESEEAEEGDLRIWEILQIRSPRGRVYPRESIWSVGASTSTAIERTFSTSTTTLQLYLVAKWRSCCQKEEFEEHAEKAKILPESTTNENKLILYGLYKQAIVGNVNTSRPGIFNMRDRAKWDAWKAVEGKSTDEAMNDYITKVKQLLEEAVA